MPEKPFEVGQEVLNVIKTPSGREEHRKKIDSIEDGVIYLAGECHREEGITYDLQGKEREGFFLHIGFSSWIEPL